MFFVFRNFLLTAKNWRSSFDYEITVEDENASPLGRFFRANLSTYTNLLEIPVHMTLLSRVMHTF